MWFESFEKPLGIGNETDTIIPSPPFIRHPVEDNKWSLRGWVDGKLQCFYFLHEVLKLGAHFRGKAGRRKEMRGVRQENRMPTGNF